MFINKKLFTTALLGLLVTLSIIALVLSLVRVEDVTLPPTVQVSQKRVPEQHWAGENQWLVFGVGADRVAGTCRVAGGCFTSIPG